MEDSRSILEQHTAGEQAIGFDYQFFYFVLLILDLKSGEKIGFEVKDDIHIDKENGDTILLQAKHTVLQKADGSPQNLTDLDTDLWKSINNWVEFIKTDKNNPSFLTKHAFVLITNKTNANNEFISSLSLFKQDNDVDKIFSKLESLRDKTKSSTVEIYIKNAISLGKRKLKLFFSKTTIETGTDNIIAKIKSKILETTRQQNLVDSIYDNLIANLQTTKYTEIKARKKFEISREDFDEKYSKCFKVAFESKPLPKREFPILLPENLENQIFIKQLLDIGEIQSGDRAITDYTTKMLKALNHFSFWVNENFVLPTDMDEFRKNSIQIWQNEFRSKYRQIANSVSSGSSSILEMEEQIKLLGLNLIDYLRQQDLSIPSYPSLGIEFSNGHYYALSDKLEIGWHFDWENKYKSP